MSFGIFFKLIIKNFSRYPLLTLLVSSFIFMNSFLVKFRGKNSKKYFNFLGRIKIKLNIDGNLITCRIPDLLIIGDVFLAEEYNILHPTKDSMVFDVGASIGLYSIKLSKSNTQIVAIEPLPDSFKILKENLEQNRIKNVLPVNMALNDKNEYLDFFVDKLYFGSSSIFRWNRDMKKIKVKAIRLDDLIKKFHFNVANKKIFIKMDVEGSELKVLKGSKKLLKNKNIKILIETHPTVLGPAEVKEFLRSYGFKLKVLDLKLKYYNQPFILAQK